MRNRIHSLTPSRIVLLADGLMISLGLLTAVFIRDRIIQILPIPIQKVSWHVLVQVLIASIIWVQFRFHKRVIRHFHLKDYVQLMLAVLILHALRIGAWYVLPEHIRMPRTLWMISYFATTFYLVGIRLFISYLYNYYMESYDGSSKKRLLIYGAGELGLTVKKSIDAGWRHEYRVMGFIDDDPGNIGKIIQGCEVYDAHHQIQKTIVRAGITDIIIATKSITPERKAAFLNDTIIFNIRIRQLPELNRWFDSQFSLDTIKQIDINDLLSREPIQLHNDEIARDLKDKTILVTGAAGSIGSELVHMLHDRNAAQIICLDIAETPLFNLEQRFSKSKFKDRLVYVLADVRRSQMMQDVFARYRPDYVFHAAAYKHVPIIEKYPIEGLHTNVLGTLTTARLAATYGVKKFVLVSTDKAIRPTSVMGAAKRIAEMTVQMLQSKFPDTEFIITRFGNVLDSNGSVVPLFKKQIAAGGPVTVTHPDMVRYFMTIGEAVQLIVEAALMGKGGEVFIFDMGEPVKIRDLAVNMIRLSGFIPEVDIPIMYTGIRPGEKLFENLFADQERVEHTHHKKIMIGRVKQCSPEKLEAFYQFIGTVEPLPPASTIKEWIRGIVPEYQLHEEVPQRAF